MTTPARVLLLAASAWLAACEGSEVRRLLNADLDSPDTLADAIDGDEDGDVSDAPDTDEDGDVADTQGDGDTSSDGDVDVGPDTPTLAFWFEGATGPIGRDLAEVALATLDEPVVYAELPGFQIDVVAETRGVALGQVARLLIDGRLAASAQVRVEGDVGRLSIPGLTLPDRGTPLQVRVETTSVDGAPLADEKRVTLTLGACEVSARLALSPEGCLESAAPGIIAAPRIVRVEVRRLSGACDRVTGVATLPDGVSLPLAEVPFTAAGTAELAIPIAFGATPSGPVSVEVTALHPSDPSQHASTTASARIDLAPPGVRWLAPLPDVTTLSPLDDQDGDASNGLQVPVRVAIVAAPDELVGATLMLDGGHVAQASVRGGGTLDFGVVTFERLGPAMLRVEAGDECDNQAIEQRTFTLAIPAPTLVIDEPSAACLSTDVLGLSGRATGLSGRALELTAASPDPRTGPVVIADFATVSPAGDWNGTYRIGADGRWNFSVSGTDVFGQSASDDVALDIDRAAPEVRIDAPPAVLDGTTHPDVDPAADGYQADVSVVVREAALGDAVCLTVNGRDEGCLPVDGAGPIDFAAVTLVAGDNTLIVRASDGCGNVAAPVGRTVTLTLETAIAIVAPASGSTLLAAGDGDAQTATTYETTMTLDADRAVAGATLAVECRPAAGGVFAPVGGRTLTGVATTGRYDVPVALDTLTLGTRAQCRAQIDRPSPGTSATIDLTIGLPAPTLTITAPLAGACLRADVAVAGGARALEGRTIGARLTAGATALTASATATREAWSTTLTLGGAADGGYTLTANATDAFGNPASAGPVALVVDRTAPALAFIAPGPDVSEADDVSTAPGIQVDVVASAREARPGGQVCLAIGPGTPVCRALSAPSVTFTAVTLQPGDNLLTLTGTDACGNAAAPVERRVSLERDAPLVVITTPPEDLTTTATTLAVSAAITDADLVPLGGLSPKLLADGVDTLIAPRDEGGGRYTFDAAPLAPGRSTTFIVEVARPNSALGRSAPRVVTQKNTTPAIALTAPSDGARFTLASAACAAGSSACVLPARATTTHAEDGSAAALAVACGGTTVSYQASVGGGEAVFAGVVLTDGQTCTLTPSVTDVVGQRATGATVTVSVDRTAPSVAITTPGPILQADDDADPIAVGMQHALAAEVAGVAAGALVTATLSWNDGTPRTRSLAHTVTTTTPDGGRYLATFEDTADSGLVDWPDGLVTLVVAVTDAAGNPGSQTLVVSVDTDAAVRITFPTAAPADTCGAGCAAGTTCAAGQCWIAWGTGASRQLVALASGMETTTGNIRVCSDHLGLADLGAPTCASPASTTGPYRQVLLTNTGGGSTVLGLGSALPAGAQRLVVEILPVSGGDWVSSLLAVSVTEQQRRVFVDLQAPAVTALFSPSDTLAPLGTLSAAEQAASPRAFDLGFSTTEAGRAQVFVNGALAATQDVPAGASTVRVTLPEGAPQVWVVMSDAVGNQSPASPGLGALTYQPTVDVTAPVLAFTRPVKSPLRLGDNLDVALSSNAEGRTVTVSDAGVAVAAGVIVAGGVTFGDATWHLLADGAHTLSATVSDLAGNVATATTNPVTVIVDTIPPAGAITAPTPGQAFSEADDAAPGTAGFQIAVSFSTSAGATRWSLATASGCDASYAACQASIVKATGSVTNPDGAEPAALVTLDPSAAESFHVVTLRTQDAAGNEHLASVGVSLTLSCAVAFTNLPASGWYNAATCGSQTACDGVIVQVVRAGDCGNRLELFDGATSLGVSTSAEPLVSFAIAIADGAPLALEAIAYQGNLANERGATGVVPIGVDLVAPAVSFVATNVQGFATPADGEVLSYGYLDDLDPSAPGMQLHAAVEVTDTHADGGAITALIATSSAGSVDLAPANATLPLALAGSSSIRAELRALTLADHLTHTVTVTARDAAGNTDTSAFVASVDVTRPEGVAIDGFVVNPRRPSFDITWTAIGIGGEPAAAYAIRYSTLPIVTEDDWDAACDASLLSGSEPMPAPAAPGEPMSVSVGGPDARPFTDPCKLEVRFDDGEPPSDVALFFAVRAFDAAGNGSELGEGSIISVSNAELWNDVSIVRFDDRDGLFAMTSSELAFLSFRGATLGDIDGDGREDWAVGSILSKAFCVFLGQGALSPELLVTSPEGPSHTCLLSSEVASIGGAFAGATQTGHHFEPLGDLNGDGLADFGVSGKLSNGVNGAPSNGYVLVYLGQRGKLPLLTSPNLKIHGLRAQTGSPFFTGFCGAGDFDGALTDGRRTSDLVIGEPAASVAHVLPGQGSWTSSTSLDLDLGMSGSLAGAWTVRGEYADPAAALFGSRCAPAGDVLPTPDGLGAGARDDILIAQTGGTSPRVFVFAGRDVPGGVSDVVHEQLDAAPSGEDARSLRLWQESVGSRGGFGVNLQGGVDLSGDGVADVLVSVGARSPELGGDGKSVYVFDGARLASLLGTDVRVGVSGEPVGESWAGLNGWVLRASVASNNRAARAIGDFDGWRAGGTGGASIDLAIADNNSNATTTVALRLNQLRSPDVVWGQYPFVDAELVNRYTPEVNALGTWIEGGADFDGDALPDLITGSASGEVLIFH